MLIFESVGYTTLARKAVVQNHHITYVPVRVVQVFKGEHYVLTLLQRRKRFSRGFLEALDVERFRMELAVVDLSNPSIVVKE